MSINMSDSEPLIPPTSVSDQTPLLENGKQKEKKSSNSSAAANIIKSFVGVGILALPYAIRNGGLWFGTLCMLVIALVSNYSIKVMVQSKAAIIANGGKCHTFVDIGHGAMGRAGAVMVQTALILTQMGACTSYVIYVGETLNNIHKEIDERLYMLMLVPILIFLAFIRNMKYLAPFSALGVFAVVAAVGVVLGYGIDHWNPPPSFPFIKLETSPLFFGTAAFALEGNLLAMTIEDTMERPHWYRWLLDCCMIFVTFLYLAFGVVGYLAFGENTQDVIAKNLPSNWIVYCVQALLIGELLTSYPVQMFPVTVVMEEWFAPPHCRLQELRRYAVRLVLVTITILMAAFIPEFGLFISFIGSFSNSFAGFILPQIFFLKLCWHTSTRGEKVANCFIIVFGLLGGGISSVISMQNIIETLSKKYG